MAGLSFCNKATGIYQHIDIDMDSKRKALEKVESALFGSQQEADGNSRCRQMPAVKQEKTPPVR